MGGIKSHFSSVVGFAYTVVATLHLKDAQSLYNVKPDFVVKRTRKDTISSVFSDNPFPW